MKKSFISLFIACISVIFLSGFVFLSDWEVDPESYYYGNVEYGEYKDAQFTLTAGLYHDGGGTVSITGQDATLFSCVSGCIYYLDTQEDHTVTIRFTPPECPREYNPHLANYSATVEFPTHGGQTVESDVAGSGTGEELPWCPE